MVFYYRKYKSLERHYSKTMYRANDDQVNIIYDGVSTGSLLSSLLSGIEQHANEFKYFLHCIK